MLFWKLSENSSTSPWEKKNYSKITDSNNYLRLTALINCKQTRLTAVSDEIIQQQAQCNYLQKLSLQTQSSWTGLFQRRGAQSCGSSRNKQVSKQRGSHSIHSRSPTLSLQQSLVLYSSSYSNTRVNEANYCVSSNSHLPNIHRFWHCFTLGQALKSNTSANEVASSKRPHQFLLFSIHTQFPIATVCKGLLQWSALSVLNFISKHINSHYELHFQTWNLISPNTTEEIDGFRLGGKKPPTRLRATGQTKSNCYAV